jgi:hypothetical protein
MLGDQSVLNPGEKREVVLPHQLVVGTTLIQVSLKSLAPPPGATPVRPSTGATLVATAPAPSPTVPAPVSGVRQMGAPNLLQIAPGPVLSRDELSAQGIMTISAPVKPVSRAQAIDLPTAKLGDTPSTELLRGETHTPHLACVPLEFEEALAALGVPNANRIVNRPRCNPAPVRGEIHTPHSACVPLEFEEALAALGVPEANRIVRRPRGDPAPARRETHTSH